MAKRLIFFIDCYGHLFGRIQYWESFLGSVVPLVGQLLYGKHYSFYLHFSCSVISKINKP